MRLTAFPVEENGIAFDFGAALSCDKHDATHNVFDGVDFIVKEAGQFIWLEVKNFEKSSFTPAERDEAEQKFLAKMTQRKRDKEEYDFFRDELRAKFIGTAAFFWLTGVPVTMPIVYVILLKSPRFDSALRLHATSSMRRLIPSNGTKAARWTTPIPFHRLAQVVNVAVVDAAEWNARFPQYPATAV